MFKLYLFFHDMRSLYLNTPEEESACILDMTKQMLDRLSRLERIALRDACLKMAKFVEDTL